MMTSNLEPSTLYQMSSPLAYMINSHPTMLGQQQSSQQQQSSSSSTLSSGQSPLGEIQEQNASLQRKLHSKSVEASKLQAKIDRTEQELQMYRQILEQVHRQLLNGDAPTAINMALQTAMVAASKTKSPRPSCKSSKKGSTTPTSSSSSSSHPSSCQCCYVAEKPFICQWDNCGRRFRQRSHLESHKNIHTGQRFTCDWPGCSKSFCRKFNLVEHAKMHTTGNPNCCTYPGCGKTFASKYGLNRHQTAQHTLNL